MSVLRDAFSHHVFMEGFLAKQGRSFPSWKKRYFILTGGKISYYKTFTNDKLGKKRMKILKGSMETNKGKARLLGIWKDVGQNNNNESNNHTFSEKKGFFWHFFSNFFFNKTKKKKHQRREFSEEETRDIDLQTTENEKTEQDQDGDQEGDGDADSDQEGDDDINNPGDQTSNSQEYIIIDDSKTTMEQSTEANKLTQMIATNSSSSYSSNSEKKPLFVPKLERISKHWVPFFLNFFKKHQSFLQKKKQKK